MLDNYWIGDIERISPEAPVPVVNINIKESRPGGSANVALNCKTLGAEVYLLTILGNDDAGKNLIHQLNKQDIHTEFCIKSKYRITTSKTRVLSKNQQIIRIDEEKTNELSVKDEHHFIDTCLRAIQIEKPDVLIFEDYNKGLLKKNVIEKIITHCKHVGVITAVDPKLNNFLSYKGVDIFKPNLKEIKEAMNLSFESLTLRTLKEMHAKLHEKLGHHISLITLSEKGIFTQQENEAFIIPAHIRNIADVSGAGDTVIAVAAMIYTVTKDFKVSAQISNLAGGLVCEQVGVVPINKKQLIEEANTTIK